MDAFQRKEQSKTEDSSPFYDNEMKKSFMISSRSIATRMKRTQKREATTQFQFKSEHSTLFGFQSALFPYNKEKKERNP